MLSIAAAVRRVGPGQREWRYQRRDNHATLGKNQDGILQRNASPGNATHALTARARGDVRIKQMRLRAGGKGKRYSAEM